MVKINFWIPSNIVTSLVAFFSFLAIIILLNGSFYLSLTLIFFSFTLDALDGYLARKFGQETVFGRQFDGFVDILTFLLYPSLVFYYHFGLNNFLSILVIYFFLLSGIFRLVRFNLVGYKEGNLGGGYPGLPVFFSQFNILALIILRELNVPYFQTVASTLVFLQGYLMLQTFTFPKPRNIVGIAIILILLSSSMFYLAFLNGEIFLR